MKTLKIDANKALELYPKASPEMKEIFHSTFGEEFFKPKSLFDTIKSYSDVCKALDQDEVTKADFSDEIFTDETIEKLIAYTQLKQIEQLFNGDWVKNWNNSNQQKWYPYFTRNNTGWGFGFSDYYCSGSYGRVCCYKDKQTSDFIGNQSWIREIYNKVL